MDNTSCAPIHENGHAFHDDDADNGDNTVVSPPATKCRRHHEADVLSTTTTTTTTVATCVDAAEPSQLQQFSGVESFLVGISPMYWAHVPMSIWDIHNLLLVNGIHCKIVHERPNWRGATTTTTKNKNSKESHSSIGRSSSNTASTLVAVSKCSLMGMVVLVEPRPGSILFVLDDGTALIDCLLWLDKDLFELPSLFVTTTGGAGESSRRRMEDFPQVGQMVRVLGRIECVAVQDIVVNNNDLAIPFLGEHHFEMRHCIREIHVTLVEPIPVSSQAQPHSFNAESWHWLDYSRRFGTIAASENKNEISTGAMMMNMKWMNANHILHHYLGPDIAQQVSRRESLPSVHDKMASWKLFGVTCQCSSETLQYKDELLYCHCQATPLVDNDVNVTDAGFAYRDALLHRLLELQQAQQDAPAPASDDSQAPEDSELHESSGSDNCTNEKLQPLQFHYKALATDRPLMAVLDKSIMDRMKTSTATTSSSPTSTTTPSLTLQQQQQQQLPHYRSRVIQKTFAALRKDGILALLSVEADVYLLISRSLVLEPFIRRTTLQQQQQRNGSSTMTRCPDYLSNVPKARLEFVRRTMTI